ncbi:hypothetical protein [Paludisphaera soli]|uniref:hypothetical protein n=1 Tax=Paludisphaera soli TaxID=2712865 RepID=UPI0013E9D15C|nr:hypothetical protein [Paludisphaera soli]
MSQRPVDAVVERLEQLEAATRRLELERRRWRIVGTALTVGVGLLVTAGAAMRETPATIEAGEFVLRDPEGKARAALTIRPDGTPGLAFYDAKERMRLSLDLGSKEQGGGDTPGVNVYGEEGELRAALTIRPDGTPGLGFFDKDRNPRLSLDMAADDSTGVNIYGPGGTLRAAMAIRPDGTPGLGLFDEAGRVVQSVDIGADGTPRRGPAQ